MLKQEEEKEKVLKMIGETKLKTLTKMGEKKDLEEETLRL
jgi:hypothetical protein